MTCKDCIHYDVCPKPYYGEKKACNDVEDCCKDFKNKADFVEVVRCKDCKYHHWEQEPEHGKTVHICSVIKAEVFKDFYCYHGTPTERIAVTEKGAIHNG